MPYNRGMKEEILNLSIEYFYEQKRRQRNEKLRARLARGKSFEEMLQELAALKGFNVEERELATA